MAPRPFQAICSSLTCSGPVSSDVGQWIAIVVLALYCGVLNSRIRALTAGCDKAVASHKDALMTLDRGQQEIGKVIHMQDKAISSLTQLYMEEVRPRETKDDP